MKKLHLAMFFLLFLNLNLANAFNFQETDTKTLLKKVTDDYNKYLTANVFFASSSNINKDFLKDFKSCTKKMNVEVFWKADLIGETIYLKKDDKMVTLQFVDLINTSHFVFKINGKLVSIDIKDDFQKNLALMKTAVHFKFVQMWDYILPSANAEELEAPNDELDEALSSVFTMTAWFNDFFVAQIRTEKEKFCNLNKKEKTQGYQTNLRDREVFKEIEYFVKVQNQYVKSEIKTNKYGSEVCLDKCADAMELKTCLQDLALRRKDKIESNNEYGVFCLKKYDGDGLYLNTSLSLVDSTQGFEQQLKILEDKRAKCTTPTWDDEDACRAKIDKKILALKLDCPPDAQTAALVKKATSRSFGSGNALGAGSK
jgi:hypothetical protein